MKIIDLIILATRAFRANTSRVLLTILGMSIGIGAIIFLVSLGFGLQKTILDKISTSDSILTLDINPDKSKNALLDRAVVAKIKNLNGVAETSPSFQLTGKGTVDGLSGELTVNAVDAEFLKLSGTKASVGRLINDSELAGIVITTPTAKKFGKSPGGIIGKDMAISFTVPSAQPEADENKVSLSAAETAETFSPAAPFQVIGVIESDEDAIFVHSKNFESLNISNYNLLKVKCRESKIMPQVRDEIIKLGFSVSTLSDTVDEANKIFNAVKAVLLIFGGIALSVSAIGMFNTMTISLLERTEEIGIMKAIGASNFVIGVMFVMEAIVMGFLGGLVGVLLGFLEGVIFNVTVNIIATHFGGEMVNLFYIPWWFALSVVVFSAFVGLATGIVPARRASRIDPMEALRYK